MSVCRHVHDRGRTGSGGGCESDGGCVMQGGGCEIGLFVNRRCGAPLVMKSR